MIAVSITIVDPTRGRVIEAVVSDTVAVTELIPHLVEAVAGEHWRLSGPLGVLRPEHCLSEAGVRPGERLTLARATVPPPPTTTIEELTGPPPESPARWVSAILAAIATVILPPFATGQMVWSTTGMTDRFRSILEGTGDPGGVTASACSALAVILAVAAAALGLREPRFMTVAAILGFGVGLQINVTVGCVVAALCVWRPGPTRVFTIVVAIFSLIAQWPGVEVLCGVLGLVVAGQAALGISGVPLPRIPATGLFMANDVGEDGSDSSPGDTQAAPRALLIHGALITACCAAVVTGVFRLIPPGSSPDGMTLAACLTVGVIGLSARGCRPFHAICVTTAATGVLVWSLEHGPGLVPLTVVLPMFLPAITLRSPLAGRVVDIAETIAFAATVPLLIATTGIFELIRGIG